MTTTNITNRERAEAARTALAAYTYVRMPAVDSDRQPQLEDFIDLLADLRHLAAASEIDFSAVLRISQYHYDEEST